MTLVHFYLCLLLLMIVFLGGIYIRRCLLLRKDSRCIWTCIRREGGGNVLTPYPMAEEAAIEFVSKNLGSVMYVDKTNCFIFYRSRTSN